jgi:hypothetical protein
MLQRLNPLLNFYAKTSFCIIYRQITLPVFESVFGGFSAKPFCNNRLSIRPRTGPLLDNSLKPGLRPALAITRKDGR